MKKAFKIGVLASLFVSAGAFCQSLSLLDKAQGTLELTISNGVTCNVTPTTTASSITTTNKWVGFASVKFGCKDANVEFMNSTLGVPADTDVIVPERAEYQAAQFSLAKNVNGDVVTDNAYLLSMTAVENVSYGSATTAEDGIFMSNIPVAVTQGAGEGEVTVNGFFRKGNVAERFVFPLMVKAWN